MGRDPGGGAVTSGGRSASVYIRNTFTLNEIWAQDKIYILVGILLGTNMKYKGGGVKLMEKLANLCSTV
jgi:hypothetical protein